MNVKAHLHKERRVPGSEKLTALDLTVYRSSQYVKFVDSPSSSNDNKLPKKAFCIVGDAAFGVPFFRALNAGLLSGSKLGEELSQVILSDDVEGPLKKYLYL